MGEYGTDKIEAEEALLDRVHDTYILRPPYLYGPMNNVYREDFVFDSATADRKFYLPKNGDMKLQFFHVRDLCKLMEVIINDKPMEHILNVGNPETISLDTGLKEAAKWYAKHETEVAKKPFFHYIGVNLV